MLNLIWSFQLGSLWSLTHLGTFASHLLSSIVPHLLWGLLGSVLLYCHHHSWFRRLSDRPSRRTYRGAYTWGLHPKSCCHGAFLRPLVRMTYVDPSARLPATDLPLTAPLPETVDWCWVFFDPSKLFQEVKLSPKLRLSTAHYPKSSLSRACLQTRSKRKERPGMLL